MCTPLNYLVWNIHGTSRSDSFRYLNDICHEYSIRLLVLIEPIMFDQHKDIIRVRLGFDSTKPFNDGKIWVFWYNELACLPFVDQLLHLSITLSSGVIIFLSIVYAKHFRVTRRPLWATLEVLADSMTQPWAITGDFNVVASVDERRGGAASRVSEIEEFREAILHIGVDSLDFDGSPYIWTNGHLWQ